MSNKIASILIVTSVAVFSIAFISATAMAAAKNN